MPAPSQTLFAFLLAERGQTHPQFTAQFEGVARELGLVGLTVSQRNFRRWVSGETVRPINAALVVLAQLFPEVRPVERLFERVGPDGRPLRPAPADPERAQAQALREALATLGQRARQRGWQAVIGESQRESAIADEARASAIRIFQPVVVPAILQVPEYTRAVYEASWPAPSEREVQEGLEDRAARQEVLARESPPFFYGIVTQSALDLPVGGPDIQRAQLRHLLEVSRLRHVDLRVLPRSIGAYPSMDSGFQLFDLADGTTVAYCFTSGGSQYLEEVASCRLWFEALSALALPPDGSRAWLTEALSRPSEE